jgi:hypothetical protein
MIIYVYRNTDGRQVDAIEGENNKECEALALEKWGGNDYHWSYSNTPVSNAVELNDG